MTYTNETDTYNETILEAQEGDFYTFLADEDWSQAQAIIDNLWDLGKDAKAEELRRAYLRAQTEVSLRNEEDKRCEVGRSYLHREKNGVCQKCGLITVRPLNEVKVEGGHFAGMEDRYPFTKYPLNTVRVQMDVITSELNPNRGDAPF